MHRLSFSFLWALDLALILAAWFIFAGGWLLAAWSPVPLGLLALSAATIGTLAAWVVARRRRSRRMQQHSQTWEQIQRVLDTCLDGTVVVDADERVTMINSSAQKLLGVDRGQPLSLFPASGRRLLQSLQRQARERGILQRVPVQIRAASGRGEEVELTVAEVPGADPQRCWIYTLHDGLAPQQLDQGFEAAERQASLGRLATGLAHQLNTPLASILLSVELLDQPGEQVDLAEMDKIRRQVEHCRKIVRGLLDLARPGGTERERVELTQLVQYAAGMMDQLCDQADVQVRLELSDQPIEILANAHQVEQVVLNLISNAIDAMPRGGTVTVAVHKRAGAVSLTVADTGIGIDPADLPRLFEPFFTTKGAGKGTGLGLATAQAIITAHGGTIDVDSNADQGSIFQITLPAQEGR